MNNRQWLEHQRSVVSSLEKKQEKNILARAIAEVLKLEAQISTFDDEMIEQDEQYDRSFFQW